MAGAPRAHRPNAVRGSAGTLTFALVEVLVAEDRDVGRACASRAEREDLDGIGRGAAPHRIGNVLVTASEDRP